MMGTPDYLAPEQALDFHAADIRADLYSLGCTWYEMLTGQPPFPGGTTLQQLLAHQEQAPCPVSQSRADVPREAEALFDQLLAKNPAERFQSPGKFLEALMRLQQAPLQPSPSRSTLRARLPLVMASIAIAFLALLGAGLWIQHLVSAAALHREEGGEPGSKPEKMAGGGDKPAVDTLGKFRGVWVADVATGFHVEMQITMKNDKVEVAASYLNKKGQLAGSFVGVDTAIRDGVLTFSQKFLKKPVSTWGDGKLHTLELANDNVLKFSWKGGGSENFTRVST
jgi:hypothetical protein